MDSCRHKWIFQETQKKTSVSEHEHKTAHFHRIDVYYCKNWCEIKKIEQKESVKLPFGGVHHLSNFTPVWY